MILNDTDNGMTRSWSPLRQPVGVRPVLCSLQDARAAGVRTGELDYGASMFPTNVLLPAESTMALITPLVLQSVPAVSPMHFSLVPKLGSVARQGTWLSMGQVHYLGQFTCQWNLHSSEALVVPQLL